MGINHLQQELNVETCSGWVGGKTMNCSDNFENKAARVPVQNGKE